MIVKEDEMPLINREVQLRFLKGSNAKKSFIKLMEGILDLGVMRRALRCLGRRAVTSRVGSGQSSGLTDVGHAQLVSDDANAQCRGALAQRSHDAISGVTDAT